MSAYPTAPWLEAATLPERVRLLKEVCRRHLAANGNPIELLALLPEIEDAEQYEFAAAITATVDSFSKNPQLCLL